jgi:diguanylate cyclase (GGDEF)-like protein
MELTRSTRHHLTLSILMVDLDRFKPINDAHGHSVGDAALSVVVRRLRATLRAHDAIGRYGGDEFLIVLPGCDAAEAADIARRLCAQVSERPVEVGELRLDLGVSIGVATSAAGAEPVDVLIANADAAMYDAKNRGRNTVADLST